MVSYTLSKKALADILRITSYYLDNTDSEVAAANMAQIRSDIQKIADTPLLGWKISKAGDSYYMWYALGKRYKVYYQRVHPNFVKVLRIHPSRSAPLKPKDIVN
jgi:plasmid stabilization system protein ParE